MSEIENKWLVYFGHLTYDRLIGHYVEEQSRVTFPTLFGALIFYISKVLQKGTVFVQISRINNK